MTPSPLEIALQRIENCCHNRASMLDLQGIDLTEIPEQVSKLEWLENLQAAGNHISDLSVLSYLPQLQKLNFAGNKVNDLNALEYVPQLKELSCVNNGIRNLDGLRYVPLLQDFFCWNNQINSLESLVYVPRLLGLMCGQNQISNLAPLKYVPLLQRLICQANQISDLSPLISLKQLQALDCRSNRISDLSVLSNLMQLLTLDCRFNQIKSLQPIHDLVMSKQLNGLHAYDNPVFEVPSGILGEHDYDNCLENLRNYWQDLAKGSEKQRQLKVQLVGNGRVGKTTLAYALEHKRAPNEPFKSTHGIVIKEIQQALDDEDEPFTLQLWDFGGQEIYHATHRLFLSDDCLYLLLWAEETEEHPDETRHLVSV
ncbi:MAG: leucine-rich repeat domain-containing protein [Thiothrix litoralis]